MFWMLFSLVVNRWSDVANADGFSADEDGRDGDHGRRRGRSADRRRSRTVGSERTEGRHHRVNTALVSSTKQHCNCSFSPCTTYSFPLGHEGSGVARIWCQEGHMQKLLGFTAGNCRRIDAVRLCTGQSALKKLNCCKSREGARAPVPHSWRRQCVKGNKCLDVLPVATSSHDLCPVYPLNFIFCFLESLNWITTLQSSVNRQLLLFLSTPAEFCKPIRFLFSFFKSFTWFSDCWSGIVTVVLVVTLLFWQL